MKKTHLHNHPEIGNLVPGYHFYLEIGESLSATLLNRMDHYRNHRPKISNHSIDDHRDEAIRASGNNGTKRFANRRR